MIIELIWSLGLMLMQQKKNTKSIKTSPLQIMLLLEVVKMKHAVNFKLTKHEN